MAVNKVDVVAHITKTTQSAGPKTPGTIIATKRGDGIWWAASGLLAAGAVYTTMYCPQWLINVFV